MDCRDVSQGIDLLVDGELGEIDRTEVEAHCAVCGTCAAELRGRRDMKRRLRGLAAGATMSPEFRARLQRAVHDAPVMQSDRARTRAQRGAAVASAMLAAVAVVAVWLPWDLLGTSVENPAAATVPPSLGQPPLVEQAVRWHDRQVPIEVTGPDADAVEAWFADKVAFRVAAPDLGRRSTLLGGRLGSVGDELAAVLVYDFGGRKLSVVMVPDDARVGSTGLSSWRTDDHSVVLRQADGVSYAFASAIPEAELTSAVAASLHAH